MRQLLIILFLMSQSFFAIAQNQCEPDRTEIKTRVAAYARVLAEEMRENQRIIHSATLNNNAGASNPGEERVVAAARAIESGREAVDSSGSCVQSFLNKIRRPLEQNCRHEEAVASCSSFDQQGSVETLISRADGRIRGLTNLNGGDISSGANCDSLRQVSTELHSTRQSLYESRVEVFDKFTEIKNGNQACSDAAEENVISNACVNSMSLSEGPSAEVHASLLAVAERNCYRESMSALYQELENLIAEKAQATCEYVNQHQAAVKSERDLYNKYRQLDQSITNIDQSIVGINQTAVQISCQLEVASNEE